MIQQTHLNRKNTIQNRYREVSDLLRDGKWQKTPVFFMFLSDTDNFAYH